MDKGIISNALELSLSTNPADRKKAYNYLEQNKHLPNFINILVSISYENSSLSAEIKQNAAIQLKNLVEQIWRKDGRNFVINEIDRNYLLSNILTLYSSSNNKHYKQIIKVIIQDLFLNWKELHQFLAFSLNSENKTIIFFGIEVLTIIAKHYSREFRKSSLAYDNTITNNYQALTRLMINLLVEVNNDTALYISKVIKIFEFSITKNLPKAFLNSENFSIWMDFLLKIISLSLSPLLEKSPSEEVDLSKNIMWIIKTQAMRTLYKLYQKYGIDFGSTKLASSISLLVNEKYSSQLLEINLNLLLNSNENYLPKDIISLIFMTLSQMVKREQYIDAIESKLEKILQGAIKLVLISKAEFEVYRSSPKTYIYNQFDVNDDENCFNIRYSVSRFLSIVCLYKRRDDMGNYVNIPIHFQFIYNYYLALLKTFDEDYLKGLLDVRYKEAVLFLIQSIKDSILMLATESIELNLTPFLIKDINDSFGMLRERACILLKIFSQNQLKNKDTLKTIVEQLYNRMHDPDLPAATAIPNYLIFSEARAMLIPYLQNILGVYLKLIGEIDIDDLLVGLENLVTGFKDEIIQYSVELGKQLVLCYKKCLETEINLLSSPNSDNNEERELNNTETSCVKTIVKLFDISVRNNEIYRKLEVEVSEMLKFSLCFEGLSHIINSLEIFNHLVCKSQQISNLTWTYFPRFIQIIIGDELKIFNEKIEEIQGKLVTIILYYIVNDSGSFISGKDEFSQPFMNNIMFLIEKLIKNADINKQNNGSTEEFEHCIPIKIMIVLLESFKGKIDSFLEFMLKLVISELPKSLHIYYKTYLVQVVALALYNNPELTLNILDKMNVTANLFELWFTLLKGMKHDFELRRTLYGFSSILLVDPSKLNPIIQANISVISSEILNLTRKLVNEYENKACNDEAEVSGDENENAEDVDDNNCGELDDFIEDDEEESEEKKEENLETLVDKQNEFVFLKYVFEFVYSQNLSYYNQLLSQFSNEQTTYLFSIFSKAETLV